MREVQARNWRRHGELRRRKLLQQDELEGAMKFSLSKACSISKYFKVADRVLEQFCSMYEARNNMEEVYVRGHRLILFLERALPKHPEYNSSDPEIVFLKKKSRTDLDWVVKQLADVAMLIDQEEHKLYIKKNKKENINSGKPSSTSVEDTKWESFSGWSTPSQQDRKWEAECVSFESSEVSTSEDNSSKDEWWMKNCDSSKIENDLSMITEKSNAISLDKKFSVVEEENDSFIQTREDKEMPLQKYRNLASENQRREKKHKLRSDSKRGMSHRSNIRDVSKIKVKKTQKLNAEDPPGDRLVFRKEDIFSLETPTKRKPKKKGNNSDYREIVTSPVDVRYDFEKRDTEIRSVPSDESDFAPRRRVRINEDFNQTQYFNPKECVKNMMMIAIL